MRPSQDRRKKRRRGSSQDMRKRSCSPSGTTAWDTAVLPLVTCQRQKETLPHLHTASLGGAVLPLPLRSGTTARAVLPPISKRYYRLHLKPRVKTSRRVRKEVRENAVLPLGSGTTARAVLPLPQAVLPLMRDLISAAKPCFVHFRAKTINSSPCCPGDPRIDV